ncbi:PEP-CTERM sorting domain-containing protein [Sphingomonas aliaeris]|uniref:PEP-CTERM sorting domain-containing protein n=1 Tax=Sphingomonas aliaeris TaxID=2759526 RepID=A0A974S4H2_9SPHN|nr:SGNH/GDSL hydrolase family protein [Sphingomonas aliaeris]QQV77593.1 PEP-CTERM sorting domain-containing protein [Sphingomonas aliaeris]
MRLTILTTLLLAAAPTPALGQQRISAPPRVEALQPTRTILFVGNSFTQGAHSALRNWRHDTVEDLNGTRLGGVPALFASFARQRGLKYSVAQETVGGKSLGFHFAERRGVLDRPWDVVVLQEYSTLDREQPGDDAKYNSGVANLAGLFRARNPAVSIYLMATWSRADLVYAGTGRWHGRPIDAMARDLRTAADNAMAMVVGLTGVIPVGEAWNRSFETGVADANPYDGITRGQVKLWGYDDYHGSLEGYYLEALVTFGAIALVDPRMLGRNERAADELGIDPVVAVALQQVAFDQLSIEKRSPPRARNRP